MISKKLLIFSYSIIIISFALNSYAQENINGLIKKLIPYKLNDDNLLIIKQLYNDKNIKTKILGLTATTDILVYGMISNDNEAITKLQKILGFNQFDELITKLKIDYSSVEKISHLSNITNIDSFFNIISKYNNNINNLNQIDLNNLFKLGFSDELYSMQAKLLALNVMKNLILTNKNPFGIFADLSHDSSDSSNISDNLNEIHKTALNNYNKIVSMVNRIKQISNSDPLIILSKEFVFNIEQFLKSTNFYLPPTEKFLKNITPIFNTEQSTYNTSWNLRSPLVMIISESEAMLIRLPLFSDNVLSPTNFQYIGKTTFPQKFKSVPKVIDELKKLIDSGMATLSKEEQSNFNENGIPIIVEKNTSLKILSRVIYTTKSINPNTNIVITGKNNKMEQISFDYYSILNSQNIPESLAEISIFYGGYYISGIKGIGKQKISRKRSGYDIESLGNSLLQSADKIKNGIKITGMPDLPSSSILGAIYAIKQSNIYPEKKIIVVLP